MCAYCTDTQLAERWSVSRNTIWRWTRAGRIPAPIRLGDNCTRWVMADIHAYEERLEPARG